MKLQNIPLAEIIDNPWRDKDLYPLDDDHVQELRESIKDHDFFQSLKGRRVNGKVEIACGHARVAAARKARLDTVPIYIADLDDDAMLKLMVEENATQGGNSPGAVLNEVAAVMRRLVSELLDHTKGSIGMVLSQAFANKNGIETAQGRLQKRAADPTSRSAPFGEESIRRYLGNGDPEKSHRGLNQIRETITALKQDGRWDDIINAEVLKHPLPVADAEPTKDTAVVVRKPAEPRKPVLDARIANTFKTETQFHAFREAVTTSAARAAIPVSQQGALAKQIMGTKLDKPKQVTAGYIRSKVGERVNDYLKEQRKIDKAERDAYLAEQIEIEIDNELHDAARWLRSLIASMLKLEKLVTKYPNHPKIGGFSARLDELVDSIKQFSRKINVR